MLTSHDSLPRDEDFARLHAFLPLLPHFPFHDPTVRSLPQTGTTVENLQLDLEHSTCNWATSVSFHIPTNSLFASHLATRRHVASALTAASLIRTQVHPNWRTVSQEKSASPTIADLVQSFYFPPVRMDSCEAWKCVCQWAVGNVARARRAAERPRVPVNVYEYIQNIL